MIPDRAWLHTDQNEIWCLALEEGEQSACTCPATYSPMALSVNSVIVAANQELDY